MKEILIRLAKDLHDHFGIVPVVYASYALELELKKSFDAHDLDVLIPHAWYQKREEIQETLKTLGYEIVDDDMIACTYHGVTIEMADQMVWVEHAKMDERSFITVSEEGAFYQRLDLINLKRLYRYLSNLKTRDIKKRMKDISKLEWIEAYERGMT